jgi:hypothetical protein
MRFTKKHFEEAAARIRALPMNIRVSQAQCAAFQFKSSNPQFDSERFFAACLVSIPKSKFDSILNQKAVDIELREVVFTIGYRWTQCDVDAALVPHFSVFCGNVKHEVGKDDLCGGGYDAGIAEKTPIDGTIHAMQDYLLMHQKWPKGIEAKAITGKFIQGYADIELAYDGPLSNLEGKIHECQEIIKKAILQFVRYYKGGETLTNSTVNAFAGPGFDMKRIL